MQLPQLDPLQPYSNSGDAQFIEVMARLGIAWPFTHIDALLAVRVIYSEFSRPLFAHRPAVPIVSCG